MTSVAVGSRNEFSAEALKSIHDFRYEIFVRRLGWSLPMLDGIECDTYDSPAARYVVVRNASDSITACARLIPTNLPYMLPELFPQLLGTMAAPCDGKVWELSRFATSVRETREGRVLSLSEPTLELLQFVIDYARQHGVKRLVLVTSIGIERLMLRAGVGAHRMAPPAKVNDALCVALFIDVPQDTRTAEIEPQNESVHFAAHSSGDHRHHEGRLPHPHWAAHGAMDTCAPS